MAERDMERAEVAKATGHVGEMEQEITLLRDDRDQVSPLSELLVTVTFQRCKDDKSFVILLMKLVTRFP